MSVYFTTSAMFIISLQVLSLMAQGYHTRRPPRPLPKWLRVLKVMYDHYGWGALTISEIWDIDEIRNILPTIDSLKKQLHYISTNSRHRYVYPIETYPYGPKKYIISVSGIRLLYRKGIITSGQARYARRDILSTLKKEMKNDPGRYSRIITKMGDY